MLAVAGTSGRPTTRRGACATRRARCATPARRPAPSSNPHARARTAMDLPAGRTPPPLAGARARRARARRDAHARSARGQWLPPRVYGPWCTPRGARRARAVAGFFVEGSSWGGHRSDGPRSLLQVAVCRPIRDFSRRYGENSPAHRLRKNPTAHGLGAAALLPLYAQHCTLLTSCDTKHVATPRRGANWPPRWRQEITSPSTCMRAARMVSLLQCACGDAPRSLCHRHQ